MGSTMVSTTADGGSTAAAEPTGLELGQTDPAALGTDTLEAQICGLASRLAADECRWLELVAEFDRRQGYGAWDCRSTSHWLSWHCGLSPRAGRERVRVARALGRFPTMRAEFAAGRLSYSKVRAITRVATSATEAGLVELALAATAAQFDRICAGYARTDRAGVDPDLPPDAQADEPTAAEIAVSEQTHADERTERQVVRIWHDDDGLLHLEAVLSPEDGAQVEAALASAQEHLDRGKLEGPDGDPDPTSGEPPSGTATDGPAGPRDLSTAGSGTRRRATRAEGLVELARAYLTGQSVSPSVERRHLVALVDAGVLTRQAELGIDGTGRCTLNGQRLTPEAARRLGASAALTTILLDHRGLPLSVGRRSRWATPAQRLALLVRDRGCCRFPGCHSHHVDAHHVVWWEHDGLTDLWNLVLLCGFHHQLLHREGHRLVFDPLANEVRVFRPDGSELQALEPDPDAIGCPPVVDVDGLPPGEEGTRLDLDLIVGNLAWLDDRARRRRPRGPGRRGHGAEAEAEADDGDVWRRRAG